MYSECSYLQDIFYDKNHQCTIFRQIVYNIINTIVQRPVAEIKRKLLEDDKFLERCVQSDKEALEYYSKQHSYPDYYLINSTMMNDVYNNRELHTQKYSIIISLSIEIQY